MVFSDKITFVACIGLVYCLLPAALANNCNGTCTDDCIEHDRECLTIHGGKTWPRDIALDGYCHDATGLGGTPVSNIYCTCLPCKSGVELKVCNRASLLDARFFEGKSRLSRLSSVAQDHRSNAEDDR